MAKYTNTLCSLSTYSVTFTRTLLTHFHQEYFSSWTITNAEISQLQNFLIWSICNQYVLQNSSFAWNIIAPNIFMFIYLLQYLLHKYTSIWNKYLLLYNVHCYQKVSAKIAKNIYNNVNILFYNNKGLMKTVKNLHARGLINKSAVAVSYTD